MAAVDIAIAEEEKNKLFVFGNAPTALFRLLEHNVTVSGVVGVPVGFVGAAESKEALTHSHFPAVAALGVKAAVTWLPLSSMRCSIISGRPDERAFF